MSRMMELTSFPLLILISLSLRYPCIISRIAAFCGESLFLLAIIKTSKLSNVILHQFEGLHKLWDTPNKRKGSHIFSQSTVFSAYPVSYY
jgi:hypothetical protein